MKYLYSFDSRVIEYRMKMWNFVDFWSSFDDAICKNNDVIFEDVEYDKYDVSQNGNVTLYVDNYDAFDDEYWESLNSNGTFTFNGQTSNQYKLSQYPNMYEKDMDDD